MMTIIITAIVTTIIVTAFWLNIIQRVKKSMADDDCKAEVYEITDDSNEWRF